MVWIFALGVLTLAVLYPAFRKVLAGLSVAFVVLCLLFLVWAQGIEKPAIERRIATACDGNPCPSYAEETERRELAVKRAADEAAVATTMALSQKRQEALMQYADVLRAQHVSMEWNDDRGINNDPKHPLYVNVCKVFPPVVVGLVNKRCEAIRLTGDGSLAAAIRELNKRR